MSAKTRANEMLTTERAKSLPDTRIALLTFAGRTRGFEAKARYALIDLRGRFVLDTDRDRLHPGQIYRGRYTEKLVAAAWFTKEELVRLAPQELRVRVVIEEDIDCGFLPADPAETKVAG